MSVTGNDGSMTYGGTYPTLHATYGGLVNGDTGQRERADAVHLGPGNSPAGTYGINCVTADPN